ncbi:velvet factor [Mycena filopes]|nr:velvet factor [Mycena filopes]
MALPVGNFPPWTLTFSLSEIQSPEVGRKCGSVDRRPLDPAPVVQVHVFVVYNPGTPAEESVELQDYGSLNLLPYLCQAELFTVSRAGLNHAADPVNDTKHLFGSTFVQPVLIHYQGGQCLVFPFTDLSSKATGDFFLRYKFLDLQLLQVQPGLPHGTVRAWCSGNPFHVYASRDAPPLNPSTALTKILADAGVPIRVRTQRRERGTRRDQEDAVSQF